MKYLSKQEEYQSPNPTQGIFRNAWVETGKKTINDTIGSELFTVDFHLKFLKDDISIILETIQAQFGIKEETMIENEFGELEEIIAFLTRGGTYDKSKVRQWGRPSFYGVQAYFDKETVWGDLQITDVEPARTIAKDWIDENIKIQGVMIGENFKLEAL